MTRLPRLLAVISAAFTLIAVAPAAFSKAADKTSDSRALKAKARKAGSKRARVLRKNKRNRRLKRTAAKSSKSSGSISATKRSSAIPMPKFNASLQLRHYTDIRMEGTEQEQQAAKQQARAIFGSTWGDLGLSFTFTAEKKAGRPGVATLKRPYAILSYTVFASDDFFVQPYVLALLPHKDDAERESKYDGSVNLFAEAGHTFESSIGSFRPKVNMDLGMDFNTDTPDATVENRTGKSAEELGIDGEENGDEIVIKEGQEDPTFRTRYMIGIQHVPSWAKDLKVELAAGMNQLYAPEYVLQAAAIQTNGNGEMDVSYPVETETYNLILVRYALTKSLSVQNEFYQSFDGVYEGARDGSNKGRQDYRERFQNVLRMSYSL